jgi:predicted nuclease of restriction endonuclease-like (RecB) superfamily
MCRIERWSKRTLEKKIGSILFERTALSRKPEKTRGTGAQALARGRQTDARSGLPRSYIRDFLGLKDTSAEKDLEAAILREMEAFHSRTERGVLFGGPPAADANSTTAIAT